MKKKVPCRLENTVRKREIACYKPLIFSFSQNNFLGYISLVHQNVELCDNGLNVLRCFQQYFSHITATVHIIHVFPGFHQYWAGILKSLAQGHSNEKPRGSRAARNQDPWITSQTLYH